MAEITGTGTEHTNYYKVICNIFSLRKHLKIPCVVLGIFNYCYGILNRLFSGIFFFKHLSFDFVLWDFRFVFILPQEGLVQL